MHVQVVAVTEEVELWRAQGRVEVPAPQAHHRTEAPPRGFPREHDKVGGGSRQRVQDAHHGRGGRKGCRDRPIAFQTVPDVVLVAALVPLERDLAAVLRRQRLSSPPRFRHEVAFEEVRDELRQRRLEEQRRPQRAVQSGARVHEPRDAGRLGQREPRAEQSEVATPRGEREEAGDERRERGAQKREERLDAHGERRRRSRGAQRARRRPGSVRSTVRIVTARQC
mmetsp:Transcript_8288/g.36650  ORF Transcript_8288/g.36650 Transcript_8288/m.36650 type:complete len:225 (+) Transcript_8288:637-1311(+)